MREFVPLDIYKTTLQRMVEQGLTEGVASRIWNCKALWLISTHPDDIRKVGDVILLGVSVNNISKHTQI